MGKLSVVKYWSSLIATAILAVLPPTLMFPSTWWFSFDAKPVLLAFACAMVTVFVVVAYSQEAPGRRSTLRLSVAMAVASTLAILILRLTDELRIEVPIPRIVHKFFELDGESAIAGSEFEAWLLFYLLLLLMLFALRLVKVKSGSREIR